MSGTMMETGKKLPLPPGCEKFNKPRKLPVLLAVLLLLCAGAGAWYYLHRPEGQLVSTRAFLGGSPEEVLALISGPVDYVARVGQPVAAGEAVLKINAAQFERQAREAEAVMAEKAGAIHPRSRELMLRYLSIPQTEGQLADEIRAVMDAEARLKDELASLTEQQAIFSLELRRLELRHNKLPEEQTRMEAMLVEEELLKIRLQEKYEQHEFTSLSRSGLERILEEKKALGRALRALPARERNELYALENEFYKMTEAEKNLALATVESPISGRVIQAEIETGESVRSGDLALYILPDGPNKLWVTAHFKQAAASDIKIGDSCKVIFAAETEMFTQGLVAELLSDGTQSGAGGQEAVYKILLPGFNFGEAGELSLGQPVRVEIEID